MMSDVASLRELGRRLEEAQAAVRALGAEGAAALPETIVAGAVSVDQLHALANELVVALRTIDLTRAAIESERRYRMLAENVSDVIWILDMETQRFVYVSPSVEKLRGYTPAEVLAQSTQETLAPESFARLYADVPARLAAYRRGERHTYVDELEQPCKGGGTVWTEMVTRYVVDPDTGRLQVFGTTRDITERKRADVALHRLSRIHTTLSRTNEAIVHAQSEEELLQRVCDLTVEELGLRAASVLRVDPSGRGLTLSVASGPARPVPLGSLISFDENHDSPSMRAFLSSEVVVVNDYRRGQSPGKWRTVGLEMGIEGVISLPIVRDSQVWGVLAIASAEPDAFDEEVVRLFAGMARDVSHGLDHIARAHALRESEEQYRALVENIEDIVYSVDVHGSFTYVSGSIARLGYAPADRLGSSVFDVVHPQDWPVVAALLADALAGRGGSSEHRALDAAGRTRFVRTSMRPVRERGLIVGMSGVLTDLSRQRETEEQLRMAQKMEAIGRLAGGVAHDFNNLLLVMMSYTELAMEALPEDHEVHDDLDEVRKAALRASGLTRQLLAFSRKQVMRTELIDLATLVSGLDKMLQRLLGEDVHLECRSAPGAPRIRADAGQVEQVIMNLAVNARDAMPDGGKLLIEVDVAELDAERASHILDATPGAYVRLAITDDGIGMDDATKARVFEPFFTTKEVGKGTGLGLATVYGIVKQTGGCIALTSAPGVGTRFEIYFPAATSIQTIDGSSVAPCSTGRGHETVLLVEDEEVVRALVRRVLTGAGYKVLVANSGPEALEICASHAGRIHALVTDVIMPGMNGRELSDRIAAARPDIKVLYTSGYTDDVLAQRGPLREGAQFLPKPFLAEELLQQIRSLLEQPTS